MYEPVMEWLYTQDLSDIKVLPHLVTLGPEADKHCAMHGYRRAGLALKPGTLRFSQEQLIGAIERFYEDPDKYLEVRFDKPYAVELSNLQVDEFRAMATELGLDFDQIITADVLIRNGVKRLKDLVAQALAGKS